MIRLKSIYKTMLWGGTKIRDVLHKDTGEIPKVAESWEVSTHPNGECLIASGDHEGKTLSEYFDAVGWESAGSYAAKRKRLPIMVKYIDARENLSIQVHPGEKYARKHENDGGKNEMWYILAADEGAYLYLGFNRDVTKQEVRAAVKNGTIEELLNKVYVKKGEVFYIHTGTVHAIGAGCLVCEIQQTSDATYRLYDYGRTDDNGKPRQLHLKKALEVLHLKRTPVPMVRSVSSINRKAKKMLGIVGRMTVTEYNASGEFSYVNPDAQFSVALVLEGEGKMKGAEGVTRIVQGESYILTSRHYTIRGNCRVIIASY